jgi:tetratricopeptide (TPR) repeat protein
MTRMTRRHTANLRRRSCKVRALVLFVSALILGGFEFRSAVGFQGGKPRGGAKPRAPGTTKEPQPESKKRAKKEKKEKEEPEEDSKDASKKKLKELKSELKLPHLSEMAVPTVAELHRRPVDWLVLQGTIKENRDVLVVKPIFPRPETLKKIAAALEELRKRPRPASPEEREKLDTQKADLQKLMVTLPEDSTGQIYEIPTHLVDEIVYHEDLSIRRAGLLVDEGKYRDALELLYPLQRTVPTWKGLEDQSRRLLYREADAALRRADYQSALVSLGELHSRDPEYSGLHARLGDVTDRLIESARKVGDTREARHFLGRLAQIEPKHETVDRWNRILQTETQNLIESALKSSVEGHHAQAATLIDRAARIWPKAVGVATAHRKICDRYQRLQVGTLSVAGDDSRLPYPTLADQRATRLERFDLFEVDRVDDATHYRSRLLEQWEPTDLGRRAFFTLRRTRSRWESRPNLTAAAIMSTMQSLIDPQSSSFDERFASYVDGIQLRSPLELEVRFSHAPPRMEPLFRFPILASDGAVADPYDPGRSGPGPVLSRRFERSARSPQGIAFRRVMEQSDGMEQYNVGEIVEHRYDSAQHEIQALMRGDVSMLLDLPPWAIASLRRNTRLFVLDYAIPTTHVLQINPQSQPLKSRELRLALAYAIDAQRILSERILRDPESTAGRLTTAPYATTSYAYNGLLAHRDFSPSTAFGLHAAAVKRLKTIPPLRLVCESDPEAQSAVTQLIAQWKRVGITVELLPTKSLASNPATLQKVATWDIAYRKLRMEEPVVELWPFLTFDSGARLESLRALPDWLRLELLELDNSPDWKSAVNRLQTLQSHLYSEVAYIPLWEVDDAIILRKNVRGFPPYKFVNSYQDVEHWIVQSWYPADEP